MYYNQINCYLIARYSMVVIGSHNNKNKKTQKIPLGPHASISNIRSRKSAEISSTIDLDCLSITPSMTLYQHWLYLDHLPRFDKHLVPFKHQGNYLVAAWN